MIGFHQASSLPTQWACIWEVFGEGYYVTLAL